RVRKEIARRALRKTQLLALGLCRQGAFADKNALMKWVSRRARQEAWRQLPLVREINTWLWQLAPAQRDGVLVAFESCTAAEIAFVLGIPTPDGLPRLNEAKEALRRVIRDDGQSPEDWVGDWE